MYVQSFKHSSMVYTFRYVYCWQLISLLALCSSVSCYDASRAVLCSSLSLTKYTTFTPISWYNYSSCYVFMPTATLMTQAAAADYCRGLTSLGLGPGRLAIVQNPNVTLPFAKSQPSGINVWVGGYTTSPGVQSWVDTRSNSSMLTLPKYTIDNSRPYSVVWLPGHPATVGPGINMYMPTAPKPYISNAAITYPLYPLCEFPDPVTPDNLVSQVDYGQVYVDTPVKTTTSPSSCQSDCVLHPTCISFANDTTSCYMYDVNSLHNKGFSLNSEATLFDIGRPYFRPIYLS